MHQFLLATAAVIALALKRGLPIVLALSILLCAAKPSDAGGMGRFLGSLVARGVVRGAIAPGRSNPPPQSYEAKSYTPDVLTVEQLANCIKKATKLDGDSERLEVIRTAFGNRSVERDGRISTNPCGSLQSKIGRCVQCADQPLQHSRDQRKDQPSQPQRAC